MLTTSALGRKSLRAKPRALNVEPLESRELFSISPYTEDAAEPQISHGGGCSCPICAGTIAQSPELWAQMNAGSSQKHALSALPQLSSLPGSQYTLFLDFNGSVTTGWESYAVTTPVYDFDGDKNTFSTNELNAIFEIWARVAEDYAPFNINVTTIDPGHLSNNQVAKIAIGGNYSDWFGSAAGGVAYVGGFYNSASNVGFVFSDALAGGVPRYVAEAATHEAGHLFGLWHQSTYNASGQKTAEYSSGNSQWAPIMGVGYYAQVTTWHVGPNNLGPNVIQDDMAILASRLGWRADEAGNSMNTAAQLQINGTAVGGVGVISNQNDLDYYRFSTGGGTVTLSANAAAIGANLDIVLELRRADGSLVSTANPGNSLGASITTNLAAGDYFLVVRSAGQYGYAGNYKLAGTVPAAVNNNVNNNVNNPVNDSGSNTNPQGNNQNNNPNGNNQFDNNQTNGGNNVNPQSTGPEITVLANGQAIEHRDMVQLGTVKTGTRVRQTFTIRNDGDSPLVLTQLTKRGVPRGFTLVQGFAKTTLAAGESTTFVLQMNHTKGSYGGWLNVTSNDADEKNFQFAISGRVNKTGIVGGKSSLLEDADAALAAGVTLSTVSMDETAFAPLHGGSNYAAVDQAFDELGDCQSAHAAATVRFDLPASKQLANDDEASAELVGEDQVEEMFAALDEALDAALATLA